MLKCIILESKTNYFNDEYRWVIYCKSGNFRMFKFSRISDFGTFHEV